MDRPVITTWQRAAVSRNERSKKPGTRGATVWLTGLPAAGKSTIGSMLEEWLVRHGHKAYLLDGDNLRRGLNGDLGFSPEDRAENVRRTAEGARLFADSGVIAIVALISPYRRGRALARELHASNGLDFIEVYVNTPIAECERRDPKGLYARARAGEIPDFTGVQDPYEAPDRPEVELRGEAPGPAVNLIVDALRDAGELPA